MNKINSSSLCHRRIIFIVTAGWMMELETLSEVNLVLLYTEVNGVNLLLHGTHAPLYSCQCLQNLGITGILLRWWSSLRRGRNIWYSYRNMRRRGNIIILIISPQLSIGLHQSLLTDRILDLHLRLASNTDA
jgi:hypothetical protein